jgi:hypothetical protein
MKPTNVLHSDDSLGWRCDSCIGGSHLGTLHKIRRPAVTAQQVLELFMRDSREQRRIVDLVAIQMQYGQNRFGEGVVERLAPNCRHTG